MLSVMPGVSKILSGLVGLTEPACGQMHLALHWLMLGLLRVSVRSLSFLQSSVVLVALRSHAYFGLLKHWLS